MSDWIRINDENWIQIKDIKRVYRPNKESKLHIMLKDGDNESMFSSMFGAIEHVMSIEDKKDEEFFLKRWNSYMQSLEVK